MVEHAFESLQKLGARLLIQYSHCVSTLLSISFCSFYLFVHCCTDLLISTSPPIHLPQALLTARQSLTESAKSICKLHRSRLGRNLCSQGGAEWQGLKTQRRQKSWKESGDVCRNKLVFWCEHLRNQSFFHLLNIMVLARIMFYLLYLGSHVIWEEFCLNSDFRFSHSDILRNDEECDPKTRSEWQTCCLFSYMEVILTRTLHLPLLFFQDFSRCFSGQGVLH